MKNGFSYTVGRDSGETGAYIFCFLLFGAMLAGSVYFCIHPEPDMTVRQLVFFIAVPVVMIGITAALMRGAFKKRIFVDGTKIEFYQKGKKKRIIDVSEIDRAERVLTTEYEKQLAMQGENAPASVICYAGGEVLFSFRTVMQNADRLELLIQHSLHEKAKRLSEQAEAVSEEKDANNNEK